LIDVSLCLALFRRSEREHAGRRCLLSIEEPICSPAISPDSRLLRSLFCLEASVDLDPFSLTRERLGSWIDSFEDRLIS